MNDIVRAPWTSEQVQALNTAQEHGTRPPRICGAEVHASGRSPLLDATHTGWICPDPACAYTQDWEWRSTLDYAAGIRAAARQASGQKPDTDEAVVAYRNRHRPIGPECGRDVLVGVHAQKPAYDAVYAYIRALGDHMPPDPVHRNAMIWRAVHAALDATPVGRCVSSHCVEGDHVLIVDETPAATTVEEDETR